MGVTSGVGWAVGIDGQVTHGAGEGNRTCSAYFEGSLVDRPNRGASSVGGREDSMSWSLWGLVERFEAG